MTEQELYRTHLKPFLLRQGFYSFRIEQDTLPDVYSSKEGRSVWIELKVLNKIPEDKILKPKWRLGQLSRAWEMRNLGGCNVVLCLWLQSLRVMYFLHPFKDYSLHDLDIKNFSYIFY